MKVKKNEGRFQKWYDIPAKGERQKNKNAIIIIPKSNKITYRLWIDEGHKDINTKYAKVMKCHTS